MIDNLRPSRNYYSAQSGGPYMPLRLFFDMLPSSTSHKYIAFFVISDVSSFQVCKLKLRYHDALEFDWITELYHERGRARLGSTAFIKSFKFWTHAALALFGPAADVVRCSWQLTCSYCLPSESVKNASSTLASCRLAPL